MAQQTQSDWFKAVEIFMTTFNHTARVRPLSDFKDEAKPLVETFLAMVDSMSYLVNSNSWKSEALLPLDGIELQDRFDNRVAPAITRGTDLYQDNMEEALNERNKAAS